MRTLSYLGSLAAAWMIATPGQAALLWQGPGGPINDSGIFGCGSPRGGAVTEFGSVGLPFGLTLGNSMYVEVEGLFHTWRGDLQITLIGPDQTRYSLIDQFGGGDDLCGSSADFFSATLHFENGLPQLPAGNITGLAQAGLSDNPASTWNAGWLTMLPTAGAHIGGTWRLVIHDVGSPDVGSITSWSIGVVPPGPYLGETPCEAAPISVGMTWTASTAQEDRQASPGCGEDSQAAWFKLQHDEDAEVTISLCDSGYDTVLGVYSGSCEAPALVACNDDFCGQQSEATFPAKSGEIYFIRVGGADAESGPFTIEVTVPPTELCSRQGDCPADLDGDGTVNGVDLGILLAAWSIPNQPHCAGADPCCADLNADGFVNGVDLGILLASWPSRPGGSGCP